MVLIFALLFFGFSVTSFFNVTKFIHFPETKKPVFQQNSISGKIPVYPVNFGVFYANFVGRPHAQEEKKSPGELLPDCENHWQDSSGDLTIHPGGRLA
jgi:hypothetical protein